MYSDNNNAYANVYSQSNAGSLNNDQAINRKTVINKMYHERN